MPALPYAAGDLAPVLSQETIEFHYGKHLQTYLNNLNAALPGSAFEG
ncbi:MAG: superoxide dismutase, partial [Fibrobacter sp.]|nr:superoxide dismutase [Fibrobacter sp.]MDY5723579.1 superoxide dismutase [Fibrobacter sp.]